MNRKQKIVLWLGIAVIVIMGIYPPWVCERRTVIGGQSVYKYTLEPGPYSWIHDPPEIAETTRPSYSGYTSQKTAKFIDLYRLGVQWCLVSLITGGLIFSFKGKARNREDRLDLKKGFARITLGLSFIAFIGWLIFAVVLFIDGVNDWYAGVFLGVVSVGFLWMVYGIVFGIVRPIFRWMKQGFRSVPTKPEKAQE